MSSMAQTTAYLWQLLNSQRQTKRLLRLEFPRQDGPVGAILLANKLQASEGLSRDFEYVVEVLSDKPDIPLKQMIGKLVTIELVRDDGSLRYFNGYVFDFRFIKNDAGFAYYSMTLLPWLAFLKYRKNNYLFHDKSLEQQTQAIFSHYTMRDWLTQELGSDEVMTDACQFNETDYNYLHRRWEARGWTYWYEHHPDRHTLVLSANTTTCPPVDGGGEVCWQGHSGVRQCGMQSFAPARTVATTQYAAASFDFKNPRPLLVDIPTINEQGQVPTLEAYEYTGAYGFKNRTAGDQFVKLRMEEIEAHAKSFEGRGDDDTLQPGRVFTLTGHQDITDKALDGDNQFLVIDVDHYAHNNYEIADGSKAEYRNQLHCLRKKIPWRPGRQFNSEEPKVMGLQTALVVGPKGEEIYTDKYGRVKVQFHWDREGQYNEKSSAWIRVASVWTGNGYGFIGIPRIGQEVIVQFMDGNPDRPLITGCLFNEANLPAWGYPAAAHQTGIQSRSTPGGGGHCELVIHDKAGSELINIHSQKDMVTTVLNNDTTVIKGPLQSNTVTTGSQTNTVHQNITTTAETGFMAKTAKQHVTLESQEAFISAKAKTAVEVEAQTEHVHIKAKTDLVLEVGASKIHMNQDGSILIEGINITINGTGKVSINP